MLDTVCMLFRYNYWAHKRVWGCITALTEEQFTQPIDYAWGSIHGQVVHTMAAEQTWIARLHGTSPSVLASPAAYPTRDAIREAWDAVEGQVWAYLDGMSGEALHGEYTYTNTRGAAFSSSIVGTLLHIVNHGTDHRAQTLQMLHRVGGPTVEQDLIFYLREGGH